MDLTKITKRLVEQGRNGVSQEEVFSLLAELTALREWQTNIRSIIVEMSRQHPVLNRAWAADRNGWGYNFEWIKWVARRAVNAERELAELKAKLPRTADGVPIVPGMVVYNKDGDETTITNIRGQDWVSGTGPSVHIDPWWLTGTVFYSTREAAESATVRAV